MNAVEEKPHHRLSPSSAERWLDCPGSVALCEAHGLESGTSDAAEAGRIAHEARAALLGVGAGKAIDPDVVKLVMPGVQRVQRHREAGDTVLVEHPVGLGAVIPGGFGTADTIIRGEEDGDIFVEVEDFKSGQVPVSPAYNPQLLLYAIGALEALDLADRHDVQVFLSIDQPTVRDTPSQWAVPPGYLREFAARVRAIEPLTHNPTALSPTERACAYCPARGVCPALAAQMPVETVPAPSGAWEATLLAPERVSAVLVVRKHVENWLASVYDAAVEQAKAGNPPPGLKLVPGRMGTRRWVDEAEAERALVEALGDGAYERKLLSPAQAEKALGKDAQLPPVVQLPTAPTLVPESDKRKAIGA